MNITPISFSTTTTTLSQENIKEIIQEYCVTVNNRLIWLTVIIGLLWLIQPYVYKKLDEAKIESKLFSAGTIKMIYKWISLGLIFMLGYSLYIL